MTQTSPAPSTRDRILEAATELFLAAGVDGVSVAEICRAAGVSNGSFFHHFPSKEELALEAMLALRREYWTHLLAGLESSADAMDGIAVVICAAFDYQRRFPDKYRFSRSDDAPWIRGHAERLRVDNAPYRGRAAMWIGAHVAAGRLPLLAPETYGALMFGTPHWIMRNADSGAAPTDLNAVAEELVRSIQKALSP
jgi:AcrR family transcriptional regulator